MTTNLSNLLLDLEKIYQKVVHVSSMPAEIKIYIDTSVLEVQTVSEKLNVGA
jgi:hypothetical protein